MVIFNSYLHHTYISWYYYSKLVDVFSSSLFVWLVADGWCWFVLREKVLVAGC
jgi:hypothetical protein